MRPTDFCHLNDLRAPVPRAFPARSATFIAWMPPSCEGAALAAHGLSGSVRSYRGTECFTTLVNASADRSWSRSAILPLAPTVAGECR